MEQALTLLNQVVIMFLLILVGFFCSKKGMITPRANKQFSNFVLTIVSAALVLDSFQQDYNPQLALNLVWAFALSFFVLFLGLGISQILRVGKDSRSLGTEQFATIFSNSGYMGIPLLLALLGPIGALYGAVFNVAFNMVSWTLGVGLMTHRFDKKLLLTALTSPVILSVFIGLPMFLLRIKLPGPLASGVSLVASLLTPLSMIVSGGFIAQENIIKAFATPRNYWVSFLRMIVIPLIMIPILALLPIAGELKDTMLILSAAPCATGTIQFAARFGGNISRASGMFTVSTIFCILTIPAMMLLGQTFW